MRTNTSRSIDWFGRRYPSIKDLEDAAWQLGCVVVRGPVSNAFFIPPSAALPYGTIGIPDTHGPLETAWALAHEVGHALLHAGRLGPLQRDKQEAQADRWAARALIPRARVAHHRNASLDAFIGALSAHYEELPLEDCAARRLAARIAQIRLRAVEEVA